MTTRWSTVAALVAAGILGAAQIGKVPAALTTISAEFGFALGGAALLVSLFALMTAVFGLAMGLAAARIGARRALLAGLSIGAVAGIAAALAPSAPLLLAARVVEGAGFLLVVVSAPGLIAAAAARADQPFAMALWGTFMPGGVALGLLSAPLVALAGWRTAWMALALLLGVAALLCWRLVPPPPPVATAPAAPVRRQLRDLAAARRPLLIAAAFASYNVTYFGLAAFLPARLESLGAQVGPAGLAAALAALANAAGNLVAGLLMRRGVPAQRLVTNSALGMAAVAAAAFAVPSVPLATALAVLASLIGGLLPAACFALIPRAVPTPALVAPAVGLVIQANNTAQLLAPPLIGALAVIDWRLAAIPLLLGGAAAALAGRALSR